MKNLYDVLAVGRNASAEEIKKNYRKLSKQYHPDVNLNNKAAEVRFKEISQAYSILSNPQSRKEYDDKLNAFAGGKQQYEKEPPRRPQQSASTAEFDIGDVQQQFEQFFGFNPKTKERKAHFGGEGQAKGSNPLDTSHIFESFFKPKK